MLPNACLIHNYVVKEPNFRYKGFVSGRLAADVAGWCKKKGLIGLWRKTYVGGYCKLCAVYQQDSIIFGA